MPRQTPNATILLCALLVAGCGSRENSVTTESPLTWKSTELQPVPWRKHGDVLPISVEAPAAGEYALLLDATAGARKSRIDTLGASDDDKKARCHIEPGWKTAYLGRMALSQGTTPLRLKLAWIDEKGQGTPFEEFRAVRLVRLDGQPSAGPPCPLDLLCPMLYDWQMKNAPQRVDRIASFGVRAVQFVIAINCELDDQRRPTRYGMVLSTSDPAMQGRVTPMDAAIHSDFRSWLRQAFSRAVERKLSIGVLLHLNCVSKDYVWRNDVRFDPVEEIAGGSYENALVLPVMESLEAIAPADWPIEFSVSGEMGTTTVEHPRSWRTIVHNLKQRSALTNATFGVGLNHTSNFGRANPAAIDGRALGDLWDECDFIGVSMYKDMSVPPTVLDFVSHFEYFASELDAMGAPLPPGKTLRILEIGIGGGGMSSKGEISQPAKTLEDLARVPWCGVHDPKNNPWSIPEYRDYRRRFHAAVLEFLKTQPIRWPVKSACLWTLGSCDPFGVEQDHWIDPEIIDRVREYNASVWTKAADR